MPIQDKNPTKIVLCSFPQFNGIIRPSSIFPPLGLGYITAMLQKDMETRDNVDVKILSSADLFYDLRSVKRKILSFDPDVIGFSCYVWNIRRTLVLCELIKEENPDVEIVLGGPEVTFTSTQILSNTHAVDVVVRGEGEETFCDLIKAFMYGTDLKSVLGITYRQEDKVIMTPNRPLINDLDQVPSPYLAGILNNPIALESCRGCPFKCAFCMYHKTYHSLRFFNIDRVCKELEYSQGMNIPIVHFIDPTFNVPGWMEKLCKAIIKRRIDVSFVASVRADLLTSKQVDLLKSAGMIFMDVGLESANPEVLRAIKKRMSLKQFQKGIGMARNAGIIPLVNTIIGLPGDTIESIRKTIEFVQHLDVQYHVFLLQVLPGTALEGKAEEYGLKYMKEPPLFC